MGQAHGKRAEHCGGFSYDVICEPPFRPLKDESQVGRARLTIIESLQRLLSYRKAMPIPYVLNLLAWKP